MNPPRMKKRKPTQADVRVSVTVDQTTWERLKALAIEQRRSLNDLLNEWISEHLPADPPPDQGSKGGLVCV